MTTYEEIRDQIEDGDLVFVGKIKGDLLGAIVKLVTKSEFVHTGIAFWMKSNNGTRRLFIVEAHQGGRRIVSLSSYSQRHICIVKAPTEWSAIEQIAIEKTGVVPYGYLDYIDVGLKELFDINTQDRKGEICSEAVAKTLKAGGLDQLKETIVSPGKLFRIIQSLGYKTKFESGQ